MAKQGESRSRGGASRVGVMAVALVVVLLAAACQDWPQYMGNPSLTGAESGVTFVSTANVNLLTQAWTFPTGASSANPIPVVAGSQLFVTSADGRLLAGSTDGVTGCSGFPVICQPLWTASIAGAGQATTPAVANGVVYEDFRSAQTPTGNLAAFDANGVTNCAGSPKVCQPLWTANVVAYWGITVAGGVVYVDDTPTRQVEAFDANGAQNCTGTPTVCQPLWTGPVGALGVPSVANGRVYVASSIQGAGGVDVFDAAGSAGCTGSPKVCQPLWTAAMPYASNGSVDVSSGVGYVETQNGYGGHGVLVAFDANGTTNCSGSPTVCQPLWTAALDDVAHINTPSVAGGRVYAPSTGGYGALDVFDAAGVTNCSGTPVVCNPLWSITQSVHNFDGASPLVVNGLVFEGGSFYDAAGVAGCSGSPPSCSPLWVAGTGTTAFNFLTDAIDKDTLFVGEVDGAVHAFRIPST